MDTGPIARARRARRRFLWLALAGRVALGVVLAVGILMVIALYVMAFATHL